MIGANKLSLLMKSSEFRVIAHVVGIKPMKSICFRSMRINQLGRELNNLKIYEQLKLPIRRGDKGYGNLSQGHPEMIQLRKEEEEEK